MMMMILMPSSVVVMARKPLWLDLQPADIKSRWRHNWKSTQVVNSYLVCDPTIRQPGFNLPRQQWSLLNRFRTEQGHCGACRRKWRLTDTDLCPCGETQTMSHIVESCPLTNWMAAYLSYTLRMKTLFCSWPVMVHDTCTRRSYSCYVPGEKAQVKTIGKGKQVALLSQRGHRNALCLSVVCFNSTKRQVQSFIVSYNT